MSSHWPVDVEVLSDVVWNGWMYITHLSAPLTRIGRIFGDTVLAISTALSIMSSVKVSEPPWP